MQGDRVLVAGGAGFIGSNLAEALAEENDVIILDDLSTGKLENIKNLKKKSNVDFIKGSITDDRILHKCFSDIDYGDTPSLPKKEDMPVNPLSPYAVTKAADEFYCQVFQGGIFNIACGRRITINQLVEMINEILGKDIEPVYKEPRPGDIKHSLADKCKNIRV